MPKRRRLRPARPHTTETPKPATGRPLAPASTATESIDRRVIVLGAGVDVPYRLPTVAGLAPELAAFSHADGAPIDQALRSKLPYLRFTFDKYAGDQSNVFLNDLFTSAGDVVPTLTSVVDKLRSDETTAPVGDLIHQLCEMATSNQLSAASLAGLARLSGQSRDAGESEPILDPQRLTLTQLPGDAL
jgi:hypothetical protein